MLSDSEILLAMQENRIVIHPFNPNNLNPNSYDVTLGSWFYREQKPVNFDVGKISYSNIFCKEDIDSMWGNSINGRSFGDGIIVLGPGENILAHTNEFIGGRINITSMMKARSSYGRSTISVCRCAGLGDIGYINRWTMEITNNSLYYHVPLVVGKCIAQICFFETADPINLYKGKYQSNMDLLELERSWKPEDMLPKLYLDA